jgi:hypothetical protein
MAGRPCSIPPIGRESIELPGKRVEDVAFVEEHLEPESGDYGLVKAFGADS